MSESRCHPSQQVFAKGFTLLELLISISLTAVLMTVLVVGLNLITRDWEKQSGYLDEKLDESLLLLQLEQAILGAYPYKFKENNLAQEELFFTGDATELRWVSTVSPQHTSGLMLWQIKTNEEGGMRINVQTAYPGSLNKQLVNNQNNSPEPQLYFKDFKVSLSYLFENTKKIKEWRRNWDAKEIKSLPIGVRMVFKRINEQSGFSQESTSQNVYELFGFIRAGAGTGPTSLIDSDGRGGLLGN